MSKVYELANAPSSSEYADGLDAIRSKLNESQLRLLIEQYFANDRSVTAGQLAERLSQVP